MCSKLTREGLNHLHTHLISLILIIFHALQEFYAVIPIIVIIIPRSIREEI